MLLLSSMKKLVEVDSQVLKRLSVFKYENECRTLSDAIKLALERCR